MDAFVYLCLLLLGMVVAGLLLALVEERKSGRGPVDAREAYDQLPTWIHPERDDR